MNKTTSSPKEWLVPISKMFRSSSTRMSRRHHRRATQLDVAVLRPPPRAPPRGDQQRDLSIKAKGQTRWFGKRRKRHINKEITLENI